MDKYYLINEKRLCRATFDKDAAVGLCLEAFEWKGDSWEQIPTTEINDRLMGYDPYEEPGWRIGNTDIMKEIREISKESAVEMLSIQGDSRLILKSPEAL